MPSPLNRLSAVSGLLILLAVASSGCDSPAPPGKLTLRELVEQVRRGEATAVVVGGEPISDEELALLVDLPTLNHLVIDDFQGTALGLEHVARLSGLERLQLRGGELGDEAMAVIAGCSNLKNLNLPNARFGDTGLAELKSLLRLELLRFQTPHVTDRGLAQIAEMKSLRFLHLIRVPITDHGLTHLESMKQLESFYVDESFVTDQGIERLLRALPELHIHINQQHSDRDPSQGTHPH